MIQHEFEVGKSEKQFRECFSGDSFFCNPCHRVFEEHTVFHPDCPCCGKSDGVMLCQDVTKEDLNEYFIRVSVWSSMGEG